ncbi:isoamyl acetate-hydrolyzing esterase 1-like [Tropilaelaps mercedesae]|uniref:Isoamyl acetate-hydrolyzing esterase 1-like n=1 Tax=Tropilaelaps mercedesae TaxID=418985 RepID=A0A1V9XRQ4_9ACAR|nr:isoamyl acetate-hydrolyzing esterase 1-like [Tropilaelaps mercedesae]
MASLVEPTRSLSTVIDYPKLFCFGDSLTQRCFNVTDGCWGSIVAARYQRQVDLLNRGFNGYTSRQAIYMLPRLLPAYARRNLPDANSVAFSPNDSDSAPESSIAALLIWFGANDACTPDSDVHVPVEEYEKNLNLLIDHAAAYGIPTSRMVLVTAPEYDHAKWTAFKARDGVPAHLIGRAEGRSKAYAEKCVEVAKKRGTRLADVYAAMTTNPDWRSLMVDGLHFNVSGAYFVAEILTKILDPLVAHLPTVFPLSVDVNRANPEEELTNWTPPSL